MILIHSTHEAGVQVGGIGAVLDGLLSAPSYLAEVERSLVVGPLNTKDAVEMERLFAPSNQLQPLYFADRDLINCPQPLADALSGIEREFHVRILYGTRMFGDETHEILLVDASDINPERLAKFKYYVWEKFGLDCNKYQHEPEFNLHIATAEPALAAVRGILGIRDWGLVIGNSLTNPQSPITILCHDFMGLPLWHAAELNYPGQYTSAFMAHEVATVRPIVEGHEGHDVRFYSVMRGAAKQGKFLEEVFGDQSASFRHALLKTAERCDHVFAVGDLVVEELRFVSVGFKNKRIHLAYNGVPSSALSFEEIKGSSEKLKQYAWILTGDYPRFVFTHVTRMVISKALWRDIGVMEQLDGPLAERGESAVLFVLSSAKPHGRSAAEAQQMSRDYGWPAQHREGWPDLIELESSLHRIIAHFNSRARACKIVLINQYGFSKDRLGESFPPDLDFDDLRKGTDLEFGQSIYEPFGISQVAALNSGALAVVSDVCGCVGFVRQAVGLLRLSLPIEERQAPIANLIMGEYSHLHQHGVDPLSIGRALRDEAERNTAQTVARLINEHLPRTDAQKQKLMAQGHALSQRMSWDVVASEQLLPALMTS